MPGPVIPARMSSCVYTSLTLGVVTTCSLATLLSVQLTTSTGHHQVTSGRDL